MRLISLFLSLFLLFTACTSNDNANDPPSVKIPKNILGKEQMKAVLIDIHLAEAVHTDKLLERDSHFVKYGIADYYEHIYDLHQTDKAQFEKSFEFYSQHQGIFMEIYDTMLKEVKKKEKEQQEQQ